MLSNDQKEQLNRSIFDARFRPEKFRTEEPDPSRIEVKYIADNYYFKLSKTGDDNFIDEFYPDRNGVVDLGGRPTNWQEALERFKHWLMNVNIYLHGNTTQQRGLLTKLWSTRWSRVLFWVFCTLVAILVSLSLTLGSNKEWYYLGKIAVHKPTMIPFTTPDSFAKGLEVYLGYLLIMIIFLITFTFTLHFFKEKVNNDEARNQNKPVIETSCKRAARVFFIALVFILLTDAGLKVSTQIAQNRLVPVQLVDILILSIAAVMLITLHEIVNLLILDTRRPNATIVKDNMPFPVLMFVSSLLIGGLCFLRKLM